MKMLLVHRYIRPDTPGYAHMLYIMGRHFAAKGHDVTIFSAQPSYNDAYQGDKLPTKQRVDGMTIIRTPLLKESKKNAIRRALNFVIFCSSLFCHAVFRRQAYDLMTITTFPPSVMGLTARVIGCFRKTEYLYHCMDLYPELAQASGILKRKWLAKISSLIDRRNCSRAKAVVVLSDDMKQTVMRRGVSGDNLHVINNFIIDQYDPDRQEDLTPAALMNPDGRFRVLFAGNIGRFQSLDTVIEAAKIVANPDIEFWFVGSGLMVDNLKEQAGDLLGKSVFFHPYLPIEKVMGVIANSHLGIVSLLPGVIDSAYPSKTMSYLEAGCKLLTLVESESELAEFVESEKIGAVCGKPDPVEMASLISREYEQQRKTGYDRALVRAAGRNHFGQDVILKQWIHLIDSLSP